MSNPELTAHLSGQTDPQTHTPALLAGATPQPEQELCTEQVRALLEGIAPGEWQRDGATVFALNEAGTNRFFATFQSPDAPPLMMIRSAELSAHAPTLARDLITERTAHAATQTELAARDAALAEAEAGREDHANGYQRLWDALWDVRERLERGWNCTPSQLIDFMQAAQEVELDSANWPAKALATAQGEKGGA